MKIFLSLALIGLIVSCAKPKDLKFIDIQHVKMIKWGLSESLIGLDARFFNPNRQRIQLKEAEVAIYINAEYLGNTEMDSTIRVPKNDTFSLPLVIKVKTFSTITKILQTISDSTVAFKVEGKVKMGKGGVFVSYPIKVEGTQNVKELGTIF
ncbi:MAG: LEA type 2 family protein [Flavitalea sp.]